MKAGKSALEALLALEGKMKCIFILIFFTLGTTMLHAQAYTEWYAKPSFLLSIYNDCRQPIVLKMQSSAHLIIDNNNDPAVKKIREIASSANLVIDDIFTKVEGKTEDATFETKVDPDTIYDYCYKIYSAKFTNCKIKYATYFWADGLSIVLNNKEYSLSCIDGGMDVHIKYLSHEYIGKKDGENLCITVTEDIPLEARDRSRILLKKGSSFCFDIIDPQRK